jgi:parallel beta-helix repeat protein
MFCKKNPIMLLWVTIVAITIAPQVILADPHHHDAVIAQCYDETDASTKLTGKVELEADMTCPCAGTVSLGNLDFNPALLLDGGELDLNGFAVSCSDTSDDAFQYAGIVVDGKHGKVKNGFVVASEQMFGITLAGEGDHSVDDVTVIATDDNSGGVGVISNKNIIKDTTVLGAGNGFVIYPFAKKNTLDSCVATNSDEVGIYILGEENDVKHCTVVGGKKGLYIETDDDVHGNDASRNSVTDSTFSSTSKQAVMIDGGEGTVISKNEIFGSGEDGVWLIGTNDFQILHNIVYATGASGILVSEGSADGEVSGNTVLSSRDFGIMVSRGSGNITISGNRALGNDGPDLIDGDDNCDDNVWDGNMGLEVEDDNTCVLNQESPSSKKGGKKGSKKVRGRRNE